MGPTQEKVDAETQRVRCQNSKNPRENTSPNLNDAMGLSPPKDTPTCCQSWVPVANGAVTPNKFFDRQLAWSENLDEITHVEPTYRVVRVRHVDVQGIVVIRVSTYSGRSGPCSVRISVRMQCQDRTINLVHTEQSQVEQSFAADSPQTMHLLYLLRVRCSTPRSAHWSAA
jgi:hypothetical protein